MPVLDAAEAKVRLLKILQNDRCGHPDTIRDLFALYLCIDQSCSETLSRETESDMQRRDELVVMQSAILLSVSQIPARSENDILCKLELWRREALGSGLCATELSPPDRVVLSALSDVEYTTQRPNPASHRPHPAPKAGKQPLDGFPIQYASNWSQPLAGAVSKKPD